MSKAHPPSPRRDVLSRLLTLRTQPSRTLVGLMSGTSLDGIDAALISLENGPPARVTLRAFEFTPYDDALRQQLWSISQPGGGPIEQVCRLHAALGHLYAQATRSLLAGARVHPEDVDLIGSHGQTVQHLPTGSQSGGMGSTLQLGDPSVLAVLTGIPTVGDFRTADVALGGQGAPLVPYMDWLLYRSETQFRGLLNLGGIANLTLLPKGAALEDVRAFDTGPGMMVLDTLSQRLFGERYDADGARTKTGTVLEPVLELFKKHPFLARPPPKSTGREEFGAAFVDALLIRAGAQAKAEDLLATAARITALGVATHVRTHAPGLEAMFVSGGGAHNAAVLDHLRAEMPTVSIAPLGDETWVDAKEAVAFAILASAWVDDLPTGLPQVTGASRPARLGKLCLP